MPAGGTLLRAFFEVAVPTLGLNSQESKILCLVNTFIGVSRQQASKYLINPHLALRSSGVDVKGTRPYILSEPEPFGQAVLSFTPKELARHDTAVRRRGEVNGAKIMANRASEIMQTAAALEQYVEENVDCSLIISSFISVIIRSSIIFFLHIPSTLQWNRYPKRYHSPAQIRQIFTRSNSEWEGVRCHHSYPSVCFQRFVEFQPHSHQQCSHAFFLLYEFLHSHAVRMLDSIGKTILPVLCTLVISVRSKDRVGRRAVATARLEREGGVNSISRTRQVYMVSCV